MSNTETAPVRTGRPGEVFFVSLPLIMSAGTFAFKLFCDRMMLAWHSETSIAAAIAAGMTAFMLSSFFMGVANYANAFVAQDSGAEQHGRTGVAVWQSMLFSLAAGMLLALIAMFTSDFFLWVGHPFVLANEESAYFLVLSSGSVFALVNSSLMCFWTGRNRTWTVVIVGFASICLNVVMNWALIFGAEGSPYLNGGPWPLPLVGGLLNDLAALIGAPSMGVVGAGLATVGTDALSVFIFLILFLRERNRREYGTSPARIFNFSLMKRMLRFGFANGMQLFMDIAAFALFNILMGRYAVTALGGNPAAASGIAISVNGVAFIPMLGLGAAASIMVGHGIGSRDIPFAKRAVRSARIFILSYMAVMCFLFEVKPDFLVSIFSPGESMTAMTRAMARDFLRLVGIFCLTDGFFILYGNAIRGAGDTKFSMYVMGLCGWGFFALPCLAAFLLGASPYTLWYILVAYSFIAAGIFYWRYRQGKWQNMKVIEETGISARRRGSASVRLSTPVVTPEAILSLPGDDCALEEER
ncbi:MAG: MATE family efflux transporter [Planctomycetota bacterium]|jgi:MATE family multidrug resistance protein|nr:MATE family efflux transporter [Planctomycetota bacterium]